MIIRRPKLYVGKLINNQGELYYGFDTETWKDTYEANVTRTVASTGYYLSPDSRAMCMVYCTGARGTIRITMREDNAVVKEETIKGWSSFYATLVSQPAATEYTWKSVSISITPSERVELECTNLRMAGRFYRKNSTVDQQPSIERCEGDISCSNSISFIVFPDTSILPNPFDVEVLITRQGSGAVVTANPFREATVNLDVPEFVWTTDSPHIEWLNTTSVRTTLSFTKRVEDSMILVAAVDEYWGAGVSAVFVCPNLEKTLETLPRALVGYEVRAYFISLPMRSEGRYCVGLSNLYGPIS